MLSVAGERKRGRKRITHKKQEDEDNNDGISDGEGCGYGDGEDSGGSAEE